MDPIETIKTRYSVRFFKPEPVSDEQVKVLLEAAVAAPTAMRAEQWFFSVVKGEDAEKMWEVVKEAHRVYYSKARRQPLDAERMAKLEERFARGMYKAPVYIAAYVHIPERQLTDEYAWLEDMMALESLSAAVENLLLAAHSLGLGAVWVGLAPLVEQKVNELAKPPEGAELVAVIPVGYPAESPKPKFRKPLSEVVRFYLLNSRRANSGTE